MIDTPSSHSLFQPEIPDNEILRDGLVDTIKLNLEKKTRIIVVQGDQEIGKTVLANQLLNQNPENSISIFIPESFNTSFIEENVLKDLYVQANVLLGKLNPEKDYSEENLNSAFQSLQYQLKKTKEKTTFILDGFDTLLSNGEYILDKIFSFLPFGAEYINYIITTKTQNIANFIKSKSIKFIEIPLLSNDEASRLLGVGSKEDHKKLFDLFQKNPGTYTNLRRLIKSGTSIDEIVQNHSQKASGLFEAEWEKSPFDSEPENGILAFVTFYEGSPFLEDLSRISEIERETLVETVKSFTFLKLNGERVQFVSASFKDFAKKKLANQKSSMINKIISYLQISKESKSTSGEITKYYKELGDYRSLLLNLQPDSLLQILNESKSSGEILKQIDFGLEAAEKTKDESSLFRFGQLKGFLSETRNTRLLALELESNLTEDNIKAALDTASLAKLNEDKLFLLGKISRYQAEKGREVDDYIKDQIDFLFDQIISLNIGINKTLDIALELFASFPEKALQLINRTDEKGESGENKSDLAFFKFSLAAFSENKNSLSLIEGTSDSLSEKKRKILSSISLMDQNTSSKTLIKELLGDKDAGDQLFFLQNWIKAFPKKKDIEVLVHHALDTAVTATAYTPNAEFYNILASTLKNKECTSERDEIYSKLCAQLGNIRRRGPTVEYIKLELNLSEYDVFNSKGTHRVSSLKDFIYHSIDDLAIKLTGICLLHKFLIDNNIESVFSDVKSTKDRTLSRLMSVSASQELLLKDALAIQSIIDVKTAIQWCGSMNALYRQDGALSFVLERACEQNDCDNLDILLAAALKIVDERFKRIAAENILNMALRKSETISASQFKKLRKLKNSVSSTYIKTLFLAKLIKIGDAQDAYSSAEQRSNLIKELNSTWDSIIDPQKRVDSAYHVHKTLFSSEAEVAKDFKNKAADILKSDGANSKELSENFFFLNDIAVRCFSNMVKNKVNTEEDLQLLLKSTESIDIEILKAKQLSRLVSVFQLNGDKNTESSIMDSHICPILDRHDNAGGPSYDGVFFWLGQVLLVHNINMFESYFQKLKSDFVFKDAILWNCLNHLIVKQLPGDPFDPVRKYNYMIRYSEIIDYLRITQLMEQDHAIFQSLSKLSDIISRKMRDNDFSLTQRSEIIRRMNEITETAFGDSRFLRHDGYKICCKAIVLNLSNEKDPRKWKDLIELAKRVPNSADVAFTLTVLADLIPTKLRSIQTEVFAYSASLIDDLETNIDKLSRYQALIDVSRKYDKKLAKDSIKKALEIASSEEDETMGERRLGLLDLAYSVDDEYANTLSSVIDVDEAKKKVVRDEIESKKNERKDRNNFDFSSQEVSKPEDLEKYPALAWDILGKLNASNYKFSSKPDYDKFFGFVSSFSPSDGYPLYSLYISTISLKCTSANLSGKIIRPIFDKALDNLIFLRSIFKSDGSFHVSGRTRNENNDFIVVDENNKNDVTDFIKAWYSHSDQELFDVVDPYFELESIKLITDIIGLGYQRPIRILTSEKQRKKIEKQYTGSIDELVKDYYLENVCNDGELPDLRIISVGLASLGDEMPPHDRWFLTKSSGIHIGTSVNGLDKKRIYRISKLSLEERENLEHTVRGFLEMTQSRYEGERVKFNLCML